MEIMEILVIKASEIRVGDEIAAADGYLFRVKAVTPTASGKTITLILHSDFSPLREVRDGLIKRVRAIDSYKVVRGG